LEYATIFNRAIAASKDKVKALADLFGNGGRETLERCGSLDRYLKDKIETLPGERVFNEETLTFAEIYVPLQVQWLQSDGQRDGERSSVQIETETLKLLAEKRSEKQIIFIQGDAGQGKSVFCRMFSDRVRRELCPSFTPILIRLREGVE
jgi:hypothetical protein